MVLDTDLGSDVDDALALAVLLGSPEVDLLGAVTVYGDVTLRARLAAGFAALAGRALTVVAGSAEPLSGRAVWVSGDEGKHFPGLPDPPIDPGGVQWLLERARQEQGGLEIVAIGPLTNLAHAIRADPSFASSIHRVWLMGGMFATPGSAGDEPAEHNFASDAIAADEVLRSGLPITVLGVEITRQLLLFEPEIVELGEVGALGAQLEREVRAWMAYWNEPYDIPHDATTVIAMLRPELFTHRQAQARVIPEGEFAGRIIEDDGQTLVEDDGQAVVGDDSQDARHDRGSPVTVVTGLDIPAVTREIIARIRAAC